jgi:hypothetical protein
VGKAGCPYPSENNRCGCVFKDTAETYIALPSSTSENVVHHSPRRHSEVRPAHRPTTFSRWSSHGIVGRQAANLNSTEIVDLHHNEAFPMVFRTLGHRERFNVFRDLFFLNII